MQADKLLRWRTNLGLDGPTKPRTHSKGPAPKHGIKFKFQDPNTWWEPDQIVEYTDPVFGLLRVRLWQGLRFSNALECRMIVAQVERLRAPGTHRRPRILWFGWVGEAPPEQCWSLYDRRYPGRSDHWYRFAKRRLHWSLPHLATPQQCQRWSDLLPFLTWELWLAHPVVQENPWQKAQTHLSPGRVCQSIQNLLVAIGTPTRLCKTRGKSPGWSTGRPRTPRQPQALIPSEQWNKIRTRKQSVPPAQKPKPGRPKKAVAFPAA